MFAHLALALVGIGIPAAYTEEPIPDLVFHHPNAVYGGDKSLHASYLELKKKVDTLESLLAANKAPKRRASGNDTPCPPYGFLYTQLPHQLSPKEVWMGCRWEEVTHTYAGAFFRVLGKQSEPWTFEQEQSSPRITRVVSQSILQSTGPPVINDVNVPPQGQTPWLWTGQSSGNSGYRIETKFVQGGGEEVRPRNYAVKLWKSIG